MKFLRYRFRVRVKRVKGLVGLRFKCKRGRHAPELKNTRGFLKSGLRFRV